MGFYELFGICFPQIKIPENVFEELSGIHRGNVFTETDNGMLMGFALTEGNALRLICVHPQYRSRGVGSRLLDKSEKHIAAQGYPDIEVGGASSRLFIGAVDESSPFFLKRGYTLHEPVAEMGMDILNFPTDVFDISAPENITFGYYRGNRKSLLSAVASVEEDWVVYFDAADVFCAFDGDTPVSFCILDSDIDCILSDGISVVGSIGCVGTVPAYRRRGIGLKTVACGVTELKKRGSEKCFIHYTHVYNWYSKLGFKSFLMLNMGDKALN